MARSNLHIIAILFLLLQGCIALVPKQPPIMVPKTMRNGTKVVTYTPSSQQTAWWKQMHDPVLNRLIRRALAKNNQIQTARATIAQAQAQLQAAQFTWLPTLQANGNGFTGSGWDSHVRPEGPLANSRALGAISQIHFNGHFVGFSPKYSLNILDNIYQNRYAEAALAVQKAQYRATRISIISQVSSAYFMLLGQREELKEQRQYVHDLKKLRQLEQSRYQHGASDATSMTDLDRQIDVYTTNLSSLKNSIAQVENALQILLDANPGPLAKYGNVKRLPTHLIPANVPSVVLKQRPDIMAAEQNLKMAEADVGSAYANFFPMISLTNLVGASSLELIHLLKLSTPLWILQGSIGIPVLNGVSYAQIKEAKAGYLAAYYTYMQTLRSAFADVDNSLTNQQKMNAIYLSQFKARKNAKKYYNLALARYQAGAKDYREVLNAKLSVDTANLNLTLAKMQQLDSIVEVYQSLAM